MAGRKCAWLHLLMPCTQRPCNNNNYYNNNYNNNNYYYNNYNNNNYYYNNNNYYYKVFACTTALSNLFIGLDHWSYPRQVVHWNYSTVLQFCSNCFFFFNFYIDRKLLNLLLSLFIAEQKACDLLVSFA